MVEAPEIPDTDTGWSRTCPVCGKEIFHAQKTYCEAADAAEHPCKKCSSNNEPSGMDGSVRVSWFNSVKKRSELRQLEWDLTLDFLNKLYRKQKGLCKLSGLPIGWSETGWDITASIDRIDNDRGYTQDNVQLVHKDVNMMRGKLTMERFKELCSLIEEKNNAVQK